jgi:cyclomaltodextrinase / maltogenic alpha-amylase / neopullulanase
MFFWLKTADCGLSHSQVRQLFPMSLPLGRYRHFKGNEYEVLGVARDSESEQEYVVYRALYGERGLWIRPLSMFTEEVERDGRRQARFTFVADTAK